LLRLSFHPYLLEFQRPAKTSRGALTTRQVFFLRAWDTAAPTVAGWGECGPIPGLSADDRPTFAAEAAALVARVNQGKAPESLPLAALPSVAFGLETALRDLAQGGRRVLWDTPFSRGEAGLPTHGLIWMDDAAGILRQVAAKVAAGFRVIKLKVGALPWPEELDLLAELRRAHPAARVELRLDANGAWEFDEALAKLEMLAGLQVAFLEQPLRAGLWDALGELCRRSPLPIALDEELIGVPGDRRRELLEAVHPQHLILKPALLGGFAASEDWIAEAERLGIGWWINSLLESNVGLNAICQWTAAVGQGRIHGLGTGGLFANNVEAPLQLAGPELIVAGCGAWGQLTV
jgi:o-succinylbenzoate synthase